MPCTYDDYGETALKQRLDLEETTKAACDLWNVLRSIDGRYYVNTLKPTTLAWGEKHDKADAKREALESARKEAYLKLCRAKIAQYKKDIKLLEEELKCKN